MRTKLINFVKNHRWIYFIYYVIASSLVKVLKVFVKIDDKMILFVAGGGKVFSDSPQVLYEQMLKDNRFKDYKLIWAFRFPQKFPDSIEKVRIDTLKYYIVALKARCWITNVSVERGLSFKRKGTFYFHTTHGTLPKLTGYDIIGLDSFSAFNEPQYDCSCAYSKYEAHIQESMFRLRPDQILLSGLPKLDRLMHISGSEVEKIKKKLGIPLDKKVILYAPTYRNEHYGPMTIEADFRKWKRILGNDYVVLFRAHAEAIIGTYQSETLDFVIDVSEYLDNIDLMEISDALISDYSGIFFEYAVLNRPMFCYAYDYDDYVKARGLYFDIREELPGGFLNEDELLQLIKKNPPEIMEKVGQFRDKYVTVYGNATKICVDKIYDEINK